MAGIDKTCIFFKNGKYNGASTQVINKSLYKSFFKSTGATKVEFTSVGELNKIFTAYDKDSVDKELDVVDGLITIHLDKGEFIYSNIKEHTSEKSYRTELKLLCSNNIMMLFYNNYNVYYHWIWDLNGKESCCGIGSYGHNNNVFTHFMNRGYGDEFEKVLLKKCYDHVLDLGRTLLDYRLKDRCWFNYKNIFDSMLKSYIKSFDVPEKKYGLRSECHNIIFKNGKYVNHNFSKDRYFIEMGELSLVITDRGIDHYGDPNLFTDLPKFNLGYDYKLEVPDNNYDEMYKRYFEEGRYYFSSNVNIVIITDRVSNNSIYFIWDKKDKYIILDQGHSEKKSVFTEFINYDLPEKDKMLEECYERLIELGVRSMKEGCMELENKISGVRTDEFRFYPSEYSNKLKKFLKAFPEKE